MPGGRLTHEERRNIGAGLAEGLGYAEIARRLGRPTSTVSREVARNGGSDGYRADRALRATERRARRRGAAPTTPRPGDGADRDDELRHFAEQFVAMLVTTGLPRMASRVLVRLFLTDSGSLTAADLVGQLRVSPASVSKAVGYLERLEVVRRERDPRGRRERYVVDDDVWVRAWKRDTRSTENWAETARRGAGVVGAESPAGVRLERMGDFFATLGADMASGPAGVEDALTLLAALVHAKAPADVERLAAGLGWSVERVTGALRHAGPGRVTPAQRAALAR